MPSALVANYQNNLSQCEELYSKFLDVRNRLSSSDLDSEVENVSMVEGLKLYEKIEHLKRKLKLIENPLLRYLVGLCNEEGHLGNYTWTVFNKTMTASLLLF